MQPGSAGSGCASGGAGDARTLSALGESGRDSATPPQPSVAEQGAANSQASDDDEAQAFSPRNTPEAGSAADFATTTGSERSSPNVPFSLKKNGGRSSGGKDKLKRRDSFSSLSAMGADTLYTSHEEHHSQKRSLPLLLTAFICVIAGISGLVVTGVHYVVLYAGCPLGVNGCNEFHHYEAKGYILPRWVQKISSGQFPESLVYIVVHTVGGLIFSSIVTQLPGEYGFQLSGGGTPQSLVAVSSGERIGLRFAVLRVILTGLYLGSGGTLGGEGPAIQVCTSVAMFVGWVCGIQAPQTQSLLACIGISCGFAASFNSPLAGTLFAMEELQHVSPSLSKTLICCILVASVVTTATVRVTHGNVQIFTVAWTERSQSDSDKLFGSGLWMLVAVPIGMLCSIFGVFITLSLRWLHNKVHKCCERWPFPVVFTFSSFVVACIGAAVFHATGLRGVWGIGAGSMQKAFDAKSGMEVWKYIVFALGKVVAMVVAVAVRAPGDVLEPVLIGGGFVGGFVGRIACYILDLPDADIMTPCIIFGMVAQFAACLRFPLTPVVIVLELTGIGSYAIILPTALASFTAITISSRLCRPLLDEIMHEDGIDLQELAFEVLDHREAEIWIDPTADPSSLENGQADNGANPTTHGAGMPRERRPSRCFLDMEEMFNEYCKPRDGDMTPSRNHSKASCGEEGVVVGPLASGQLKHHFRERSNSIGSVGSHRSSRSHSNGSSQRARDQATDHNAPPVRGPPRYQRPRSNSVTSVGSRRGRSSSAADTAAAAHAAAALHARGAGLVPAKIGNHVHSHDVALIDTHVAYI